jgi:hypothetical protein
MPLQRTDSVDSTCTVLTCTPDQFLSFFNDKSLSIDEPVRDVMQKVVDCKQNELRDSADSQWDLHKFLNAMKHPMKTDATTLPWLSTPLIT